MVAMLRHCWKLLKIAVDSSPFGLSVFRDFDRRRGTKSPPDMQDCRMEGVQKWINYFPFQVFHTSLAIQIEPVGNKFTTVCQTPRSFSACSPPSAHELLTRLWVDQMATEARNGLRTTHSPTAALFRWRATTRR